ALRQYAPKLPADLRGPITASLGALDVSGRVGPGTDAAPRFQGDIRLQDLSLRSPVGGKYPFTLDHLTVVGSIESRLDRGEPAAVRVRDGMIQGAPLTYSNNPASDFPASWRIESQVLMTDHCTAQIFAGPPSGSFAWDLATGAVPPCR